MFLVFLFIKIKVRKSHLDCQDGGGVLKKIDFVYDTKKRFQVQDGAEGWQLSNAPVLGMASHKASLDIFSKAGFSNLIEKSKVFVLV